MADYGFSTLSVHAGAQPDPATGARITPIYQTASYVFENAEQAAARFGLREFGNIYSRLTNPTTSVLEERVAALEGGSAAVAVSSGHAAQFAVLFALLGPGDEFVAATQLYGGSINQFSHTFKQFGWNVAWADGTNPESFKAVITPKTKAIWIESIANPAGTFTDIEAIAKIAHANNIPLIVDNTLATPYLIRPFEWGADVITHSGTKFLNGHGNSIAGLVVDSGKFNFGNGRYPLFTEPNPSYHGLKFWETFGPQLALAVVLRALALRDLGPTLSPFNAFLTINGIETLPLRVQRHSDNALAVAKWLKTNPHVSWVNYAGLPENASYALQQKYSPKGAGSVFTFGVKGGFEAGKKLVDNVKLFSHLANIGDTRSLIIHPASTTHSQLSGIELEKAGAAPDVVRLSVGIEDAADIIADLEQALAA